MALSATERRIGFGQAARENEVNPSTVYRWARFGLESGNGVIHLEYEKRGRRLVTSREALSRFFRRLTDAHREGPASTGGHQFNAEHEQAERELAEAGL